jgi:hypothetical protein
MNRFESYRLDPDRHGGAQRMVVPMPQKLQRVRYSGSVIDYDLIPSSP